MTEGIGQGPEAPQPGPPRMRPIEPGGLGGPPPPEAAQPQASQPPSEEPGAPLLPPPSRREANKAARARQREADQEAKTRRQEAAAEKKRAAAEAKRAKAEVDAKVKAEKAEIKSRKGQAEAEAVAKQKEEHRKAVKEAREEERKKWEEEKREWEKEWFGRKRQPGKKGLAGVGASVSTLSEQRKITAETAIDTTASEPVRITAEIDVIRLDRLLGKATTGDLARQLARTEADLDMSSLEDEEKRSMEADIKALQGELIIDRVRTARESTSPTLSSDQITAELEEAKKAFEAAQALDPNQHESGVYLFKPTKQIEKAAYPGNRIITGKALSQAEKNRVIEAQRLIVGAKTFRDLLDLDKGVSKIHPTIRHKVRRLLQPRYGVGKKTVPQPPRRQPDYERHGLEQTGPNEFALQTPPPEPATQPEAPVSAPPERRLGTREFPPAAPPQPTYESRAPIFPPESGRRDAPERRLPPAPPPLREPLERPAPDRRPPAPPSGPAESPASIPPFVEPGSTDYETSDPWETATRAPQGDAPSDAPEAPAQQPVEEAPPPPPTPTTEAPRKRGLGALRGRRRETPPEALTPQNPPADGDEDI